MIVLNPNYFLRHDRKRSLILSSPTKRTEFRYDSNWISVVHPIYAMVLSFFTKPVNKENAIDIISKFLSSPTMQVETMLQKLVDNPERCHIDYLSFSNDFPRHLLVSTDRADFKHPYPAKPEEFLYKELDLTHTRMFDFPVGIVYVVNNRCITDCIYCYADKRKIEHELSLERIRVLVEEMRENKLSSLEISGGDFFVHPHWKELLAIFTENGFTPGLLSTKKYLSENDVEFLASTHIPIQISLDSLNPATLSHMVGDIKDYSTKIKDTIGLLEKHGVSFQIATVLTNRNGNAGNLDELYEFTSRHSRNLRKWEIRRAFKSLYAKKNFDSIRLTDDSLTPISEWANEKSKKSDFSIEWVPDSEITETGYAMTGSKDFKGPRCSANITHIVILPDGKVTMCEQLYWNERFIIGDINNTTLKNIWQSDKAYRMTYRPLEDFKGSRCAACSYFENCFNYPNKCHTAVIKRYGDKHWNYPDPRCRYAPELH